jgi:hypothetical protein
MPACAAPRVWILVVIAACVLPWPASASGGGENLFKLKAAKLDTWTFWAIFAGMIFYGILIDRGQYWVMEYVKDQRLSKMIVERCITEFMIFGIVAMSLFFLMSVIHFGEDSSTTTLLHFCDMLVSVAACTLIGLSAIYSFLRTRLYDMMASEYSGSGGTLLGWGPMSKKMVQQFMALYGLDDHNFSWDLYFDESLANQICNFINIKWETWLVAFCVTLPMILYKAMPHRTVTGWYIAFFALVEWGLVLLIFATGYYARKLREELYATLSNASDDIPLPDEAGTADVTDELLGGEPGSGKEMIERMKYRSNKLALLLQIESTLLCFSAGIYLMHVTGNIDYGHASVVLWKIIFNSGNILGLVVLGPLALLEVTSIQAFADPDQEVMKSIMDQVNEVWTSFAEIRRQIEQKGYDAGYTTKYGDNSPKVWAKMELTKVNGDATIAKSDLKGNLKLMGIRVSGKNAKAIFKYLEVERDAAVGTKNLLAESSTLDAARALVESQIPVDTFIDIVFESDEAREVSKQQHAEDVQDASPGRKPKTSGR